MTKNRSIKIAVLVLALALITSCFVGTTFARYTSTSNGVTTLEVAAFSIKVNGEEIVTTNATGENFELNKTIVDTVDGATDAQVADKKIAPGTKGKFYFTIQNLSDVTVAYTLSLALDKELPPLQFALSEDAAEGDWKTLAQLQLTGDTIAHDDDAVKTVEVFWRWKFGDAAADNQYANIGTVNATMTLVVDQVD